MHSKLKHAQSMCRNMLKRHKRMSFDSFFCNFVFISPYCKDVLFLIYCAVVQCVTLKFVVDIM
jgi:hypothetical protein